MPLPGLPQNPLRRAAHRLIPVLLILRQKLLRQLQQLRPLQLVLLVGFGLEVLLNEADDLLEEVEGLSADDLASKAGTFS